MSSNIEFSIIIPTYNRAAFLDTLLSSLTKQTYKKFEVIICDDGSTDNTKHIASKYSQFLDINYIYIENTGGPAIPRNTGIVNSKYDWLCFLDSDDGWTNDKLEILKYYIDKYNNDIYCHNVSQIDINSIIYKKIGNYRKGLFKNDFKSLLYNGSQVVNSSLCVRKSIITEQYLYNINIAFKAIEDYIFILKLTYAGYKIYHINKVLGYYRVHEENISMNKRLELKKIKHYFSQNPFLNINQAKLYSLFKYISLNHKTTSKINKIYSYYSLIISTSSFEIKLKSFFKIIQIIFKKNQM